MHSNFDGYSIGGSLLSIGSGFLGLITANQGALYMAILSGALASIYTAIKIIKELKGENKNNDEDAD